MTGLLTVPERLAAMALDASPLIQFSTWTYQRTLDELQRPAVVVEVEAAQYPASAASLLQGTENYKMLLIGSAYGTGNDQGEAELATRQIVDDLLTYFAERPNLVMSNLLHRQPTQLPGLRGVRWSRIDRSAVVPLTRGEDVFWGCDFSIAVEVTAQAMESLR